MQSSWNYVSGSVDDRNVPTLAVVEFSFQTVKKSSAIFCAQAIILTYKTFAISAVTQTNWKSRDNFKIISWKESNGCQ